VGVAHELSLSRDLDTIMGVVRPAARELTGTDGATFMLRDGDLCFYADENAISPLWKGHRFPITECISGWAMLHQEAAVIEDICAYACIPQEA
jgi:GAF domain-containing protein